MFTPPHHVERLTSLRGIRLGDGQLLVSIVINSFPSTF
jgi:hypothetical protein